MHASIQANGAFKGEAIVYAAYIINQIPTHVVQGMTPYEKWYGTKPSISHL
jgi:hypothetical protein